MTKNELLGYLQFLYGLCKDAQQNPNKYEVLFDAISYLEGKIKNSENDEEKIHYLITTDWGEKTYLSLSPQSKKLLELLSDKLNIIKNDAEIINLDEVEYDKL